ncbi:nucleotidyl transferase AbiEii/AbiGii toxin family protein [Candidatus Micrarchaeota archaeon]|nr:nucleotidyl transferase AbiEii/AbiGii toxin family protein [Candidatus Micrarchaeota archaeon]
MLYDAVKVRDLADLITRSFGWSSDKRVFLEKDVWLSLVLRYLYSLPGARERLVFKGGTALVKCFFGYYRFSEDLDFTWFGEKGSKKLNRRRFFSEFVEPLKRDFGFGVEESASVQGGVRHSHSGKILNYFLLAPPVEGRGELKVKVSVSFDEAVVFEPERVSAAPVVLGAGVKREAVATFGGLAEAYFEPFEVSCYSREEIVCEKMRALLTRREKVNRSRDIVDLMRLGKVVDLRKVSLCSGCRDKIGRSLRVGAWRSVFDKRKVELDSYLSNVVGYALNEPVYIEPLNKEELDVFALEKLKPVLFDLISALEKDGLV